MLTPLKLVLLLIVGLSVDVRVTSAKDSSKSPPPCASGDSSGPEAVLRTSNILKEVIDSSFPELKQVQVRIRTLEKEATFFETRFSIYRYLTFHGIRINLFVNPCVFVLGAPPEGIKAIIAHELAHADYYRRKNLFQLLSLVRLVSRDSLTNFERKTDLKAIERGYGDGLIKYRQWLYRNIPQMKVENRKRNYFTPEEIALLSSALRSRPELMGKLLKNVPRNLSEATQAVKE